MLDTLLKAGGWSLLFADDLVNQNEVLKILSISDDGRVIRTRQLIEFNHYGGEYQAEVALLSRRILFTTDDASLDGSGSIGEREYFTSCSVVLPDIASSQLQTCSLHGENEGLGTVAVFHFNNR